MKILSPRVIVESLMRIRRSTGRPVGPKTVPMIELIPRNPVSLALGGIPEIWANAEPPSHSNKKTRKTKRLDPPSELNSIRIILHLFFASSASAQSSRSRLRAAILDVKSGQQFLYLNYRLSYNLNYINAITFCSPMFVILQ